MKKNNYLLCMFLLLSFVLVSCDKTKGKVEEKAKQFVESVNGKDVATIYDMYPNAKSATNMELPDKISTTEIEVVKDTATGNYIANLQNPRDQRLIFKPINENTFKIVDSYGLFQLDEMYSDMAVKTGVPLKKLSDQKLKELFSEDGKYLEFIKEKFSHLSKLNLYYYDGVYNCSYNVVEVTQNIENIGDFAVKGSDYNVIFRFIDKRDISAPSTKCMDGVDLAPGESFTYTFNVDGYSSAAYEHEFTWSVSFEQKGGDSFKDLMKKAKFTGNEYTEFLKEEANSAKQKKNIKQA